MAVRLGSHLGVCVFVCLLGQACSSHEYLILTLNQLVETDMIVYLCVHVIVVRLVHNILGQRNPN